jgi:hypothetical protein
VGPVKQLVDLDIISIGPKHIGYVYIDDAWDVGHGPTRHVVDNTDSSNICY